MRIVNLVTTERQPFSPLPGPDGDSRPLHAVAATIRSRQTERDLKLSLIAASIYRLIEEALTVTTGGVVKPEQVPQPVKDDWREASEALLRRCLGGVEKDKALRLTRVHAIRWMESAMLRIAQCAGDVGGPAAQQAVEKAFATFIQDMFPVDRSDLVNEILVSEQFELTQPLYSEAKVTALRAIGGGR